MAEDTMQSADLKRQLLNNLHLSAQLRCQRQAGREEVAEETWECLRATYLYLQGKIDEKVLGTALEASYWAAPALSWPTDRSNRANVCWAAYQACGTYVPRQL